MIVCALIKLWYDAVKDGEDDRPGNDDRPGTAPSAVSA